MGGGSSKSVGQAKVADFKEHEKVDVPDISNATQIRPSPPKAVVEATDDGHVQHVDSYHEEESEPGNSQNESMVLSIDEIYEAASRGADDLRKLITTGIDVNLQDSSVSHVDCYWSPLISFHPQGLVG